MVEDYKKVKEMSGDDRIGVAKKTIMVFPGITKAFIEKATAIEYLTDSAATADEGKEVAMKVLFKVAVDLQGDMKPMDVKKFLGDDPAATGKGMSDALMQRLMVQVQSYSIEDKDGNDVANPEKLIEAFKNGDTPSDDWKSYYHVFHVRQLENQNDPNTSTNVLDAGKADTWKALIEKEEKKAKEQAEAAGVQATPPVE